MSVTDVEREFLEGILATEPGTHSIQDLRYAYFIAALDGTLPGSGGREVPDGGSNGQVLKIVSGSPAWAADTNTTYTALSAAEAQAGTSTAARTISAKVLADEIDRRVAAAIAAITPPEGA